MRLKDFCEKKADYFIMVVVLTIYVCMTLSNPSFTNFNHDEVHAWNIASNFGFFDIIRLMRSEGHTFIWFILMKPFTCLSIYSIKWLNWMFTFGAIFLLWRFAPFKTLEKLLITFSCPFLLIYPVVARCYGVGILLLFILAILYKRRFEHPILYSILIFLTANTSLMTAIPALMLGCIFAFEIIKQKKDFSVLFILLAVPLSLYIQWHNPIIPFYSKDYIFVDRARNFFFEFYRFKWCNIVSGIIYTGMVISSVLYFYKNLKILYFLLFSWISLLFVFAFVYCGFDYHFYFFYVYLIFAYWITGTSLCCNKKIFAIFFILLSILYCFKRVSNIWMFKTYYKENAMCITKELDEHSIIYTNLFDYNVLLPYINNSQLKDYNGKPLVSFDNFKNIYLEKKKVDLNNLYEIAPPNSYLLLKAISAKDLGLDFSQKENFKECGADILY